VSERIFRNLNTPLIYLYGPELDSSFDFEIYNCRKVVIRTEIEGGTDNLNPPGRTFTYIVTSDKVFYPEIHIDVEVPANIIQTTSIYKEHFDMRPVIGGARNQYQRYVLSAHIPPLLKRTQNIDYPDFCLFFIPCRHLVFQGPVVDPQYFRDEDGIHYETLNECIDRFQSLIQQLHSPPGSEEVSRQITPFITTEYYYPYDTDLTVPIDNESESMHALLNDSAPTTPLTFENETVSSVGLPHFCVKTFDFNKFREYITSSLYGIGKGLAKDFDYVELCVDDSIRSRCVFT